MDLSLFLCFYNNNKEVAMYPSVLAGLKVE